MVLQIDNYKNHSIGRKHNLIIPGCVFAFKPALRLDISNIKRHRKPSHYCEMTLNSEKYFLNYENIKTTTLIT